MYSRKPQSLKLAAGSVDSDEGNLQIFYNEVIYSIFTLRYGPGSKNRATWMQEVSPN